MRGVNTVILIGNATRDAELRHTKSGKPVSNIRLATNRKVGGEEQTQYHTVICWDTLADTTSTYVKKGDRAPCKRVDVLAAEAQPTCQWATTEGDPDRAGGWPTAPAVWSLGNKPERGKLSNLLLARMSRNMASAHSPASVIAHRILRRMSHKRPFLRRLPAIPDM